MKFKAAVLREFNTPLTIEELEIPKLKYGQVLVQVYASGVCGAQLGHISGVKVKKEFLPFLLGHEGSGIVIEVGEGVKHVKVDDQVVMHWRPGDGVDSEFPKYKTQDGSFVGGGLITTFNEYAVVSENRVTTVAIDNVAWDIAAMMGCSVTTGLGLINNEAKLKMGESIIVFGAGGVGLNVIQGAKMVSADTIVAIDINEHNRMLSINFGAEIVCDTIKNLPDDFMADVVVDTTGVPMIIAEAYRRTRSGGRTILVGQPKKNQSIVLDNVFIGKTLMDSQGGLTNPSIDINNYLRLYKKGKLNLHDLIGNTFSLEHINEAIDALKSGTSCGRIIIEMGR